MQHQQPQPQHQQRRQQPPHPQPWQPQLQHQQDQLQLQQQHRRFHTPTWQGMPPELRLRIWSWFVAQSGWSNATPAALNHETRREWHSATAETAELHLDSRDAGILRTARARPQAHYDRLRADWLLSGAHVKTLFIVFDPTAAAGRGLDDIAHVLETMPANDERRITKVILVFECLETWHEHTSAPLNRLVRIENAIARLCRHRDGRSMPHTLELRFHPERDSESAGFVPPFLLPCWISPLSSLVKGCMHSGGATTQAILIKPWNTLLPVSYQEIWDAADAEAALCRVPVQVLEARF